MSNKQASVRRTAPERDQAWLALGRLAAAQRDAVAEGAPAGLAEQNGSVAAAEPTDPARAGVDHQEFERAVAEIEQASAALRRAEPNLATWVGRRAKKPHKPQFVWALIVTLWLATGLVIASVAIAIAYFIHLD
jgi:hypothetical protein